MTPKHALLVAVLALAMIVAGVAMLAGPAWALIATGMLVLGGTFVLYDPDAKPR